MAYACTRNRFMYVLQDRKCCCAVLCAHRRSIVKTIFHFYVHLNFYFPFENDSGEMKKEHELPRKQIQRHLLVRSLANGKKRRKVDKSFRNAKDKRANEMDRQTERERRNIVKRREREHLNSFAHSASDDAASIRNRISVLKIIALCCWCNDDRDRNISATCP